MIAPNVDAPNLEPTQALVMSVPPDVELDDLVRLYISTIVIANSQYLAHSAVTAYNAHGRGVIRLCATRADLVAKRLPTERGYALRLMAVGDDGASYDAAPVVFQNFDTYDPSRQFLIFLTVPDDGRNWQYPMTVDF